MSLSAYQQVLAGLEADARQAVEDAFAACSADVVYGRVSRNVADETAFVIDDFTSLLNVFAARLAGGETILDAWLKACRAHKLKGRLMPDAACPVVLGRTKGLEDHAAAIAKASRGRGDLTREQARKLLLKYSGSLSPLGFETFLREAPLGNYFVWATFNSDDPHVDPFARLPSTHQGICTALGLGHYTLSDTLIVLVWKHAGSGSPPLHRPTVADAENYPYYRPRPDADAHWGLTEPLPPNPDGLLPQPEVIMPETTSQGLQLPFRVVQA
jgi:hypothetical protein